MTWQRIGFFAVPQGRYPWMHSHAQLPTPLILNERLVRVLFASRDKEQRSHIAYVDLLFAANGQSFSVEQIASEPVMSPGPIGHFDEHGVYPSCIVKKDGAFYLFYIGWNQGVESPLFYASIGLASSIDGKQFTRVSPAPILSRSQFDPCLVTSPHVYIENDRWHMAYVSGIKWTRTEKGNLQSHYHIKLAEAENPREWVRHGKIAIDFAPSETNIARPTIIQDYQKGYRMWFAYVNSQIGKYRIGYAESKDGTVWRRNDVKVDLTIDNEHCREMITYPSVFRLGKYLYMLYNGDNYGEVGFCVTKL